MSPKQAENQKIRSLTSGVLTNVVTTEMPVGSWITQTNGRTTEYGVERFGGLSNFSDFLTLTSNLGTEDNLNAHWFSIQERIDKVIEFKDPNVTTEYLILTEYGVRRTSGNASGVNQYTLINPHIDITNSITVESTSNTQWVLRLPTADLSGTTPNSEAYTGVTGDFVHIENSSGTLIPLGEISSITTDASDSLVTVDLFLEQASITVQTPAADGRITHCFDHTGTDRIQYTSIQEDTENMLILTNNKRGYMLKKGNSYLQFLSLDGSASVDYGTLDDVTISTFQTCATFGGRLWIGNTSEVFSSAPTVTETAPRRVRFSLIDSVTDDSAKFTFYPENYVDLDEIQGDLIKLLPLSELLIAYCTDSIYIGRQTGRADLPVAFEPLATGRRGLINPYAVASWNDNHYVVSSDDVYTLDVNRGWNPLNLPILQNTLNNDAPFEHIVIEPDADNSRICIGFPRNGTPSTDESRYKVFYFVWSYMYKRNAWFEEECSYTTISDTKVYNYGWIGLSTLSNVLFSTATVSWADIAGQTPEPTWETITGTWEDYLVRDSRPSVLIYSLQFVPYSGFDYKISNIVYRTKTSANDTLLDAVTFNSVSQAAVEFDVNSVFETPDFDFGFPNLEKTVNRLSVKLRSVPDTAVSLTVQGSVNAGDTWKSLGTLTIPTTSREGKLDFRLTADAIRLRLTQTVSTASFTMEEYILRTLIRGDQAKIDY